MHLEIKVEFTAQNTVANQKNMSEQVSGIWARKNNLQNPNSRPNVSFLDPDG